MQKTANEEKTSDEDNSLESRGLRTKRRPRPTKLPSGSNLDRRREDLDLDRAWTKKTAGTKKTWDAIDCEQREDLGRREDQQLGTQRIADEEKTSTYEATVGIEPRPTKRTPRPRPSVTEEDCWDEEVLGCKRLRTKGRPRTKTTAWKQRTADEATVERS